MRVLNVSWLCLLPLIVVQGFFHTGGHRQRVISGFSSDGDLHQEISDVAVRAARKAGECIKVAFGLEKDIKSKIGSRDIVTEFDTQAQEIIRQTILEAFPDHNFLGEEDVAAGRDASTAAAKSVEDAEHLWIVDPIDGTTNFALGIPLCGVIIAYASRGKVMGGYIYDPNRDEMFTAWRGQGTYLNGKRIHCCNTKTLKDSVVCTGSPPNFDSLQGCLRATNLISDKVRTVRYLGSASIMLSWLALGRIAAYFETDMNVWDIAAGSLMVQEAGGKVTDVWGGEYGLNTRNLVSSNGIIHNELLDVLVEAEMWMPQDANIVRK